MVADTYDFFDEEIYKTAIEVYEKQKLKLKEKVRSSGIDYY